MSVLTVIHYLPAETGFVRALLGLPTFQAGPQFLRASLGLPSFAILSLQLTTYG